MADAEADRPPGGRPGAALLPPAVAGWPATLRRGPAGAPDPAALARVRAQTLFWPAPRAGAARPRALALDAAARGRAREAFADADIATTADPAAVEPDALSAVFGPPDAAALLWARFGGIATPGVVGEDPAALLGGARGVCPWTGRPVGLDEALAAQALLRAAAMRARGPARLAGMSAWKRAGLAPFLTGPDGPPRRLTRRAAATAEAGSAQGPLLRWGDAPGRADLRVEDGFLRSVGLGLRHVPPLSLAIRPGRPHFDATGPNAFDATVAAAAFTPELRARAAALRAGIVAAGLTKYNLPGASAAALPEAGGRLRLLAPGQVAGDASIRLGARAVRDDLALLEAARARFPQAFILYRPHPDTRGGRRAGRAPEAAARRLADAVETAASAEACLGWCDRVATITSLMGFEALLRGRAVTVFGRPFYAGWGLTDDVDPPSRDRTLDIDDLVAAALILHVDYVDPVTRLPCPPEVALAALARERAAWNRPGALALRIWRNAVSWTLNRL
jgi:capsular polysaccharide export protein